MREVIAEAQGIGVDADQLQVCAGKEDWDGLKQAIAGRRRQLREDREAEAKAAAEAAAQQPLPVSEAEQKLIAAEAALKEANDTIADYDRQLAQMALELDDQQRELRQGMETQAPGPEPSENQPGNEEN